MLNIAKEATDSETIFVLQKGKGMLQRFFSSKTRVKLLQLFINNPESRYYLRGIGKLLNESLTPLRRELLNLKDAGFLKSSKVANLIYYEVNEDFFLYEEFRGLIKKTEQITIV